MYRRHLWNCKKYQFVFLSYDTCECTMYSHVRHLKFKGSLFLFLLAHIWNFFPYKSVVFFTCFQRYFFASEGFIIDLETVCDLVVREACNEMNGSSIIPEKLELVQDVPSSYPSIFRLSTVSMRLYPKHHSIPVLFITNASKRPSGQEAWTKQWASRSRDHSEHLKNRRHKFIIHENSEAANF